MISMSDLLSSILQGIVEGLTEFLPVSSTAHILLTQEILGTDRTSPYWKMFAVVIQLGAILSVLVYFRQRLWNFVKSFLSNWTSGEKNRFQHPLVLVLLSFVVTAIPCFLADELIGENMESLAVIACALLVGAIVMILVDRKYANRATTHRLEDMTAKQAVAVGLFQILAAAFPGTSRSMATIVGGQMFGLSRAVALEFSFFLAIPVMTAAAVFRLLQHIRKHALPTSQEWFQLAVGFVVSFLVAYVVIAWFMNWVRSRGFMPFAVYRVLLALLIGWYLIK
jgi:undecaprenyl-diphosphatase